MYFLRGSTIAVCDSRLHDDCRVRWLFFFCDRSSFVETSVYCLLLGGSLRCGSLAIARRRRTNHSYNTLEDANLTRWTWVCVAAVASGAMLCLVTGFAGYLSFFNVVEGEILDSFPDYDVPAQARHFLC